MSVIVQCYDVIQLGRRLPRLTLLLAPARFKEQSLSKVLVQACNLDPNANANANKAINWRRGSGKSAGNFPAAMEEVCMQSLVL